MKDKPDPIYWIKEQERNTRLEASSNVGATLAVAQNEKRRASPESYGSWQALLLQSA